METVASGIRLPKDLKDALVKEAKYLGITLNQLMVRKLSLNTKY